MVGRWNRKSDTLRPPFQRLLRLISPEHVDRVDAHRAPRGQKGCRDAYDS